jgi:hypothetical protein
LSPVVSAPEMTSYKQIRYGEKEKAKEDFYS